MHLFEIGEEVEAGLRVTRDPYPHFDTPTECDRRLLLWKGLSDMLAKSKDQRPQRMKFAELEFAKDFLVFHRDRRKGMTGGRKAPCLVRVRVAGGIGGVARLLANCFTEAIGKEEEVGRSYFSFPSAGVNPFCSEGYLVQLRTGLEFLDVMMLLQPGAGFRIHRTGDLRDQHGVKADPQMSVRWTGWKLSLKGYNDHIPVLNHAADAPQLAEE